MKQSRLESDQLPTPNDVSSLREQSEPCETDDVLDDNTDNNNDHDDEDDEEIDECSDLFS
jgi:hypothetical protein